MTRPRTHRRSVPAFTLVELMVVISVIAIVATVMVPAFGQLLRSINYSAAVNTVSATLGGARATAVRDRRYTAVAFLFDVETERYSLQVLELQSLASGQLSYAFGSSTCGESREAFVYRPATGQVPIQLPKGTGVYGLSFQVSDADCRMDNFPTAAWYSGWTQDEDDQDERPLWLFPMNDPRHFTENDPPNDRHWGIDPWEVFNGTSSAIGLNDAQIAVRHAQTFVVQFSPTGAIVTSPRSGETTFGNAYIEWPSSPVDRTDPAGETYDWPDLFDPENLGDDAASPPSPEDRSPNPEVFVRSADQLAVVDLNELGHGTRIERPWFVRPAESGAPQPDWLADLGYFSDDQPGDEPDGLATSWHRRISDWIDANADILSFDRYSGKVI